MRKRLVVAGAVVLVVAVAGAAIAVHLAGSQAPASTYLTATAAVTDVVDTVSVTGSVQAVETYALAFGQAPVRNPKPTVAGAASPAAQQWMVQQVMVHPGDHVASGVVLAVADPSDAQQALDTAQLNLAAAKARLALDEAPVTPTSRAKARLAITQADRALSQARSSQTQTASNGRLAVDQAQGALDDAQTKLSADRAAGAPAAAATADEAAVKGAQRALDSARHQAATANLQATAAVQNAALGVQSAQLAYQGTTTVNTDAAVAADRAAVSQAETAAWNAKVTLDRLTLTAPIAGTVASIAIQPGDEVSGTVVVLRSTDSEVDASVTETDLPAVKVGQPARVTVNALAATVQGTVSEVDLAGATKSAGGVVSYSITITLANPPALAAPGMTADVDITTATAAGVVAVPASAVGGSPGAYTVEVYDGPGVVHTVPVEVGLLTASLAEIRSGISAGMTVVTGVATAKDLVTTFPTGPGSTRTAAPTSAP